MRRFTLASLRDFGMGRLSIEGKIHDELSNMIKKIASHNGKPFDPKMLTMNAVSNVICSIVFGSRFDYDDPDFEHLMKLINATFMRDSGAKLLDFMPWLENLPPFSKIGLDRMERFGHFKNFIQKLMDEHERTRDPSKPPTDFLDAIMQEAANNRDANMAEMFSKHRASRTFSLAYPNK